VHTQRSLANAETGVRNLSLLLYVLAKNGLLEDATAVIADVDASRTPEIRSFLDWYDARFLQP
jgi:hypothetical protein